MREIWVCELFGMTSSNWCVSIHLDLCITVAFEEPILCFAVIQNLQLIPELYSKTVLLERCLGNTITLREQREKLWNCLHLHLYTCMQ